MKIIGKPYSGKPNVRFDEGELEIEHIATTPALYSTETCKNLDEVANFSLSRGLLPLNTGRPILLHSGDFNR